MENVASIEQRLAEVERRLLDMRRPNGHWVGELSSSALAVATAVTALQFYRDASGDDPDEQLARHMHFGVRGLVEQQNADGGFGDTALSHSNISTTMLAIAALHACRQADHYALEIEAAERYVDDQGGIPGLRARYGNDKTFAVPILAHCAMAGIVPWKEVSALPFEAACVPQRFYHLLQLPVVSYAIPALVAIGQVKFLHDPPWDPIRKSIRRWSIEPSLKVLQRMQPESGGFLEAVPLTSFVAMALIKCGRHDHPVVESAIRFLKSSFREIEGKAGQGTWPIDTNLATWGTTLSVNALANDPVRFEKQLSSDRETWRGCLDWILGCQTKDKHPFTGAQPGGFGWTDLSGAVPDADDTPGALIAIRHFYDQRASWCDDKSLAVESDKIQSAARAGVDWLVGLQNRDKGWPTFCKGWGKLPFDRSGSDITAHSIRGLIAWKDHFSDAKILRAIDRGFEFLKGQQNSDGSWLPLWFGNQDTDDEINPWYGTAKVLLAYRDANLFDTEPAKFGLEWIIRSQNDDGGWGGGASLNWAQLRKSQSAPAAGAEQIELLGNSSVEETALCTETLLHAMECDSFEESFRGQIEASAKRGVAWLLKAIELDCISIPWPIGFYFAKLWYFEQMYPLVFATSALTKALSIESFSPTDASAKPIE